jgi:hypothetical protein
VITVALFAGAHRRRVSSTPARDRSSEILVRACARSYGRLATGFVCCTRMIRRRPSWSDSKPSASARRSSSARNSAARWPARATSLYTTPARALLAHYAPADRVRLGAARWAAVLTRSCSLLLRAVPHALDVWSPRAGKDPDLPDGRLSRRAGAPRAPVCLFFGCYNPGGGGRWAGGGGAWSARAWERAALGGGGVGGRIVAGADGTARARQPASPHEASEPLRRKSEPLSRRPCGASGANRMEARPGWRERPCSPAYSALTVSEDIPGGSCKTHAWHLSLVLFNRGPRGGRTFERLPPEPAGTPIPLLPKKIFPRVWLPAPVCKLPLHSKQRFVARGLQIASTPPARCKLRRRTSDHLFRAYPPLPSRASCTPPLGSTLDCKRISPNQRPAAILHSLGNS